MLELDPSAYVVHFEFVGDSGVGKIEVAQLGGVCIQPKYAFYVREFSGGIGLECQAQVSGPVALTHYEREAM